MLGRTARDLSRRVWKANIIMSDERRKPSVLIVDDNVDNLQLLRRALLRQGYQDVRIAESSDAARGELADPGPDAVVVDLDLLIVDGYALLRLVRPAGRGGAVPVLALVSRQSPSTIRAAALKGVNAFIPQPFNAGEISYKIEQAVRVSDTRAAEDLDLRDTES
jgi:DNA-binding response OmpR family regulator